MEVVIKDYNNDSWILEFQKTTYGIVINLQNAPVAISSCITTHKIQNTSYTYHNCIFREERIYLTAKHLANEYIKNLSCYTRIYGRFKMTDQFILGFMLGVSISCLGMFFYSFKR